MSGVAFTTISPSSTNSRRSTPCVDGCCGPIEIVICVSSGRSTISNCGGIVAELINISRGCHGKKTDLLKAIRFVTPQWKIFAQCMSLPIVGQQDPSQIRMAVEDHAKQIECLALVPVCCLPNARHARHVRVFFIQ